MARLTFHERRKDPMKKQFIVTLEDGPENVYDDWDGIAVGDIKDGVADWTGMEPINVTVEEISVRGKPTRVNAALTMITYATEDAL